MLTSLAVSLLLYAAAAAGDNVTQSSQCSCGFRDPGTGNVFTESIIMYFNETGVDQNVFDIQEYQNKNQRGWNSVFRQGADPSNVIRGDNGSLPWQDYIDGTSPSLEMWLDGFRFDHHSIGAQLRTLRRDILYGTFRASMRSAQPWVGGSAMSMYLQYNTSQSINIDLCNMNEAPLGRVLQLIDGEWPEYDLATNYTVIAAGDPPQIPRGEPFDFMDVGYDWTNQSIDFWVGNNRTRHVRKDDRDLTSVPQTLYLSHWSTGDIHYMQGPPPNRSVANVRWVRAFFNSSLMTVADHEQYDRRCHELDACSVEDMTLRGSSPFSPAATVPWERPVTHQHIRDNAGYVAAAFTVFGVIAIVNAIIRRGPWYKFKDVAIPGSKRASTQALRQSLRQSIGADLSNRYPGPPSGGYGPAPGYTSRPGGISPHPHEGIMTPLPAYESGSNTPRQWSSLHLLLRGGRVTSSGRVTPTQPRQISYPLNRPQARSYNINQFLAVPTGSPRVTSTGPASSEEEEDAIRAERTRAYLDLGGEDETHDSTGSATERTSSQPSQPSHMSFEMVRPAGEKKQLRFSDQEEIYHFDERQETSFMQLEEEEEEDDQDGDDWKGNEKSSFEVPPAPQDKSVANDLVKEKPVPDAMAGAATIEPTKEQPPQAPNQPQQRIDYLAGLVGISCILVTGRHFSLTFWPFVTENQGNSKHFQADTWLSFILGPYLLGPLWIGPFFVTSCRFLAQRYLRTGKLNDVANKMLLRAPRMLIPVFVFMTLEYFLISLGLTARLEWLPSVTYSSWPYVTPQSNFGVFLNEAVELAYLPLNSSPEVINHYCVGVLWTIPVQLQFSFVVLLATVLIKDVKKPWKRMLFYSLSILAGWYATSWSACHWLGLLLADADITYNWVKWSQARWYRLYPILFGAFLLATVTPLAFLFNSQVFFWSFPSWENAIHPEATTGLPIFQTIPSIWYAYPTYYAPNFPILVFSAGLQIIVELSTWTQWFLSLKMITFLHPHIMTIYLIHGFIFWSLGSFTVVSLSNSDLPYWAILLITATVCYTTIFLFAIIATPMIEFATKGSVKNIWRWATEEPVPHRRTTAPFTKYLVLGRHEAEEEESQDSDGGRRPHGGA